MEELFKLLKQHDLNTNFIEVSEDYTEPKDIEKFNDILIEFIRGEQNE